MKTLLLKVSAFACAAVYLIVGYSFISEMMAATTRNFYILNVIPSLLGAVLFLVYGVTVNENMSSKNSVWVGLGNLVIGLLPNILLAILLSPGILLTLPAESWKNCILPMVLSLCPFGIALWRKATHKSEKV